MTLSLVIDRAAVSSLVAVFLLVGISLAAQAADEPTVPVETLRFRGHPLSNLVATAVRGALPVVGDVVQPAGAISGVALDRQAQPLARHEVTLDRVMKLGRKNARVSTRTTTDETGRFSFTGLEPGSFELVVRVGADQFLTPVVLSEPGNAARDVEIWTLEGAPPARSFVDLHDRVNVGARVAIVRTNGIGILGKITAISAEDSLVSLDAEGGARVDLLEGDVATITMVDSGRGRSARNGALAGLLLGALITAPGIPSAGEERGLATIATLLVTGISTGVGAALGALSSGDPELIYAKRPGATVNAGSESGGAAR